VRREREGAVGEEGGKWLVNGLREFASTLAVV